MQRHQALRKLSSDHHTGLVLARRARDAVNGNLQTQTDAWLTVVAYFQAEMDAHFRLEENGLLPVLLRAGEKRLVERTLYEHETLRQLITENRAENLLRFAELLTAHIRFEEKELFETAQRLMDADTLEVLGREQKAGKTL